MIESEKLLEKKLGKAIGDLGGLCWKLFPLHITGLPDRLCLLPGGRVLFVELKTTDKKATSRQLYVHAQLRALGFQVAIIDTTDGINGIIKEYGLQ